MVSAAHCAFTDVNGALSRLARAVPPPSAKKWARNNFAQR
jgi:hypothetical protein